MNGLIKDIANARIDNMIRLHSLLDKVLETCATGFAKDNSIELDRNMLDFHVDVPDHEGYKCVIETNVNTSCVRVSCIDKESNEPVAQCEISIFGQFAETYSRITNIDLKLELAKWFTQISCIDVKELETTIEPDTDIPNEAEENIEDNESSTTVASDGTEVEVVDEDESIAD